MKIDKKIMMKLIGAIIFLTLISLSALTGIGQPYDTNATDSEIGSWRMVVELTNLENSPYNGHLRVYVVEPVSRWNNYQGEPYHFGFLDFAIDESISIDESYVKNVSWDPEDVGGIDVDNFMIIASVFNDTAYQRYSYSNRQFDAYFVDACAASTPGIIGYNQVTEDFTHTVFAEEATATWCPACPKAADALYDIYESEKYPFYFVALVGDMSQTAMGRLVEGFNLGAYPTSFFDGGNIVEIGSPGNVKMLYEDNIKECGGRSVPALNLSVHLFWDPDESFPEVSIVKPENGLYVMNEKKKELNSSIIIGITDIEAEATDRESEIVKVEFYINDELRKEDSIWPYEYSNWKETKFFGRYTIKVVAYDEADNQNSDEMQVLRFF